MVKEEIPNVSDSKVDHFLNGVRWAAYAPTIYRPLPGQPLNATENVVHDDLKGLYPFFDGLITYGTDYGQDLIPKIAQTFAPPFSVLLGIWQPGDSVERERAVTLAHTLPCIDGVICGNEGLFFGRYDARTLASALDHLRESLPPQVLLSTTEPLADDGSYAVAETLPIDFHALTIHPYFTPARALGPIPAADYVIERLCRLRDRVHKPILVKETSWPHGGAADATEEAQFAFWSRLLEQAPSLPDITFAIFEAYSTGDWKTITQSNRTEPFHGFRTNDRKPLKAASLLPVIRKGELV
jgi:exo-beta-1,3-glucanase (GH17 family)